MGRNGVKWTPEQYKAHMAKIGQPVEKEPKPAKAPKVQDEEPKGVWYIKNQLQIMKVNFITEYEFLDGRKFRFDIIIHSLKIAIEYEGIYAKKSRHTNKSGYAVDCEKYNQAVIEGWRMLRYTAKTYENFIIDFEKLRNG